MKRALLIILASAALMVSCTTMTFIPEEGTAAKFNLATVDYINAKNEALAADVTATVQAALDTMLAEDLDKIQEFSSVLDSLDASLADLIARMDSLEMGTAQTVASLSKDVSSVKTNASSTRMVIRRLNDNIDTLPAKTLETFTEAIRQYLESEAAEDAGE